MDIAQARTMQSTNPEDAASSVATLLQDRPPESDRILTPEWLLALADVEDMEVSCLEDSKKRSLWMMCFINSLQWELLEKTSRLLENVWGQGWRLTDLEEVTSLVESKFWGRVTKAISTFGRRVKVMDPSLLSARGQQERMEAQQRVNAATFALRTSMQSGPKRRERQKNVQP